MYRKILKDAIFVIIIPIIFIATYLSGDHPYVKRRNDYIELVKHNVAERPNTEVLFLGDSHAKELKQHFLGQGSSSLADGGDGVSEMLSKLMYGIRRLPNLKVVVLACDFHMFSKFRTTTGNRSFILACIDRDLTTKVYGVGAIETYLAGIHPFFDNGYYVFERNRLVASLKTVLPFRRLNREQGSADSKKTWEEISETERRRIASKEGKGDFKDLLSDERNAKLYKQIIDIARERDLRVVGVVYPATSDYFAELKPEQRKEVMAVIDKLGLSSFLDYSDLLTSNRYFRNSDHMNELGARIVLDVLRRDTGLNL